MVDVSIVIVSWNTCEITRKCLLSVYKETDRVSFEVVLVDNGSTDGSAQMVRDEFPEVILIGNEENRGFAAANNQGIKRARGKYLLLLNSDTVVLDHAVERVFHFMEAHSKIAVTGCRVLNEDGTLRSTRFMFPSVLNLLLQALYLNKIFRGNRFFGRERMLWDKGTEQMDVDVVAGCFMMVRTEATDRLGMLDEEYFVYGEETDWCYRFKRAGWRVVFYPDAEIIHLGGRSSRMTPGPMLLQLWGSLLLFFRKRRTWLEYGLACLFTSLFFSLRIPIWAARSTFWPRGRAEARRRCGPYLKGAIFSLLGGGRLRVGKKC